MRTSWKLVVVPATPGFSIPPINTLTPVPADTAVPVPGRDIVTVDPTTDKAKVSPVKLLDETEADVSTNGYEPDGNVKTIEPSDGSATFGVNDNVTVTPVSPAT